MRTPPTNGRAADDRRGTTERRILESASRLILEGVGWNQLGIRQIAERAEISRTAFYDFFGSKSEVVEQLIAGLHDDLGSTLSQAAPSPAAPGADLAALRGFLWAIADFNVVHGPIYRAFLDATGEDPRLADLLADLTATYLAMIASAIDDARVRHPAAPRHPASEVLGRVLLAMTERTMLHLLREAPDRERRDETLDALAQVWERSVFGNALTGV